jgi:ABC-type spermidine/putrescine transport system permease subunit I
MAKFTTMTTRRRWSVPLLLLGPTLLVMAYAFVAPLLTFFEYSFYRFRRGRLEQVFTLDTYSRFLFDEYYHLIIYDTLRMATLVTVLSLLIGYPLAMRSTVSTVRRSSAGRAAGSSRRSWSAWWCQLWLDRVAVRPGTGERCCCGSASWRSR